MADTVHTLEIKTTLKDGISGPLRKAGDEARAVGQKAAQGMAQVEQSAQRSGRAFEAAFGGGLKRGLGSLAIGISSAASASQGLDKNIISLGANLAGAFAVGGPVGLGVSALATGLGHLIGKATEAAERVDRLRDSLQKASQVRMDALQARWDELADLDLQIEATRTGQDVGSLRTKKEIGQDRSQAELDLRNAERDIEALQKALSKTEDRSAVSRLIGIFGGTSWNREPGREVIEAKLTDAKSRAGAARATLDATADKSKKVDTLEAEKKAADERKQAADDARKAEEEAARTAEQRRKVTEDINKEIQDQVDLLRAADERERLLVEQAHERRDVEAKGGDLKALAVKHAEQLKDLEQKQNEEASKAAEKQAEKARAKAESVAEANEQLRFELDTTTATSEIERLRVQQARELSQARREGLDIATLEKRHAEEMKQAIDREKQALEDKKKAQEDFIHSLREEAMIAGAKDDKERAALEEKIQRVHALQDAYKKAGAEGVKAQMDAFKAQDKQKADADRAAKNDPLKGWNADMGMGPLAYLRQQKKADRQRKKWERTAANLRAEARDRMGFTVGEDGGGWGVQLGAGDMDYKGKGGGGGEGDSAIVGGPPAPQDDGRSDGDPANKVADSAKATADASKQQAESLGKAAEAAQSMATEATAAKDAAATSADAATQSSSSLKEAASSLKDASTAAKDAATAAGEAAGAAKTLATDLDKLKADIKRLKDALKLS